MRGALLLMLNDDHPNIEKFITQKTKPGKLVGANVSVGISDSFMENKNTKGTKEAKLWSMITESAWASAEPGVIFMERYNKMSNSYYHSEIVCTNPCLHKDTLMVTENGLEKISELSSPIWNTQEYVPSESWMTGNKEIVRVKTNSGFEYLVTPDHKFLMEDNSWEEASKIVGKRIKFEVQEKEWKGIDPFHGEINYEALGLIFGHGEWNYESNQVDSVGIFFDRDNEVRETFLKAIPSMSFSWNGYKYVAPLPHDSAYAMIFNGSAEDRVIPDFIFKLPKNNMREFIRGFFSRSSVNFNMKSHGKIQLASLNYNVLKQIQNMLMLFGIKAKLRDGNKKHVITFSEGAHKVYTYYYLVLSRISYEKYLDDIGFIQSYKNGYVEKDRKAERTAELVVSVEYVGRAEVWDFQESNLHRGVTNGAIVHNCGEQGLPANGVCNLGHLVLPRFYDEKEGDVDWNNLERAIKTAVRFQDNVIDYSPYFLEKQKLQQLGERRVGMGTMGLGTLLIQMGIPYGSDESVQFCDKLYKFIAVHAYLASADLAKEKGSFPLFNKELHLKSGFIAKMPDEVKAAIIENGIRNVTILTQAPTGSTGTALDSLFQGYGLDGVSTGIEPYFAFEFWRASRAGKFKQTVNIARKYEGKLPPYFVSADQVSPEGHVRVQAAIQRWTDSSISKTINMPNESTVEDVEKAYKLAYDLGIKGVTVYRDGSRSAQVLSTKEDSAILENQIEANKIKELKDVHVVKESKEETMFTSEPGGALVYEERVQNEVQKRPSRLYGFTEKVRIMLDSSGRTGKVYITINVDSESGLPVEVFINANDPEIRSTSAALGRMTTQFLRFGSTRSNVEQAIKHLQKGESFGSLPFILGSLLNRVESGKILLGLEDGVGKVKGSLRECPQCKEFQYEKASCVCLSCGYSSCN